MATYEELMQSAEQIRTNELPESNTHELVGQHLKNQVEHFNKEGNGLKSLIEANKKEVDGKLTELDNKKLNVSDLAQSTGTNTKTAMSQDAITEALAGLLPNQRADKTPYISVVINDGDSGQNWETFNRTLAEIASMPDPMPYNGDIRYFISEGLRVDVTNRIFDSSEGASRRLTQVVTGNVRLDDRLDIALNGDIDQSFWRIYKDGAWSEWKSVNSGGGSGNVDVVQETGSSTTAVMSQAAVTNEVNQIENNLFRKNSSGYMPWQPNKAYNDGDVVIANGQLVECLGGSDGGEEYDPGEWGATTVDAQSRKRDKDLNDSKLSIQDLAETTGTSTKTAMTQKAVTEKFAQLTNLPEAPADGSTYGRKNKGWVKTIGRSGTGNSAETFNNASNAASGNYAHAEGDATNASGHAAHAEGQKTKATGYASHAEGGSTEPDYQTHAEGKFAHAEGNRTHAAKDASHAEGYATTANGTCSHAEGNKTTATGEDSHAEGNTTNAVGLYAHAEGQNTTAKGQAAHAEGNMTKTGECSTYDSNYETISTSGNNYGHAEGNNTAAGGMSSHAEGEGSNAFGRASHSEGQSGAAIGLAAHSEGELTMACGEGCHSEGIYTQAGKAVKNGDGVACSGSASHAEGYSTKALGDNSHAEGKNTIANNESEHAQGRFNASHTHASDTSQQTIDSVGIGTKESDRKNATETMANGDLYIYGIGGYNGKNPSEAQTLQQVAANIPIIMDDFYDIVRQLTGGSNVLKGSYTAPTVKPSELFDKLVFGRLKDSEGVYGSVPLTVRKDYGDRGDFYWFTFFLEGIYGVFAMNVDVDDTWGDIMVSNFKHKNIFE